MTEMTFDNRATLIDALRADIAAALADRRARRAAVRADRVARAQLAAMSDRQLADLAFERETVADRLDAARSAKPVETAAGGHVARWFAAHREERRIRRELGAYSDADLLDLGIGRGDIAAVARGEPVLTFRDAGTVDRHFAAGTVPTAANRPARRRVA